MSYGSSTPDGREATGADASHADRPHLFEQALELPPATERRRWWSRPGVSERGERSGRRRRARGDRAVRARVGVVVRQRPQSARGRSRSSRHTGGARHGRADARECADDRLSHRGRAQRRRRQSACARARGASGKLRANIQAAPNASPPDSLPAGGQLEYSHDGTLATAPRGAGIWNVLLAIGNAVRPVANFNIITLLPFSTKQNGRIGTYYIGSWPSEHGATGPAKAPPLAYANPAGFIEVTAENADTPVSEHFKLRDFLTHDQPNVWPKYLVLQQRLIDKLELVLEDLEAHGHDVHGVHIMSGFRSPQYNYTGGNTGGRANLSRHMYGDASDIFIDNDGDGQMDDLNHDGKISIADSQVISWRQWTGSRRHTRSWWAGQECTRPRRGTDLSFISTRAAIVRAGRGLQEADVADLRRGTEGGATMVEAGGPCRRRTTARRSALPSQSFAACAPPTSSRTPACAICRSSSASWA